METHAYKSLESVVYQMAPMTGPDGAGGADSTDVSCIFEYYTHTLHKVKRWHNALISIVPLHWMNTCVLVLPISFHVKLRSHCP